MKMYKEMLRKLMPVGMPLALATLIYTLIVGGQNYFGSYTLQTPQSAMGLTPVLAYYVFAAVLFALYGFSFLFKRAASDMYHSLPVPRLDLYLSVTLGTATWMGGTILINVLLTLGMLLVSGCPFVPVYIPLNILFYFVAAMLIYAAAAVGCAVSGTLITALASTGVVLFLPRLIQFVFARGVVAKVPIIGWLDLTPLLDPVTNVATGLVVMHTRQVYMARIIALPAILYSLLPMAVLLVLGAWLFMRRHSELAERGSGKGWWTMAMASMLALAALLMITVDSHRLLSVYGAALTAVAFLVFVVYQFVAARSFKQVLYSVPCFLLSALVAYGVSAGINATANGLLNTTPAAAEIASVTFRGHDERYDTLEYTTMLMQDIQFTSEDIKKYVADSLADAVDRINDPYNGAYNVYSQYQVIEPIQIRLTNGTTFKRTIEFKNVDTLNQLRAQDSFFQGAIRAFPADSAIQYRMVDYGFTDAENKRLWESYVSESQTLGLVGNDYYRERAATSDSSGNEVIRGGEQVAGRIASMGHVADARFSDNFPIRLETPKTVSMLMGIYNSYAKPDTLMKLKKSAQHIVSPLVMESDSLSLDLSIFNLPKENNVTISKPISLYISGYSRNNDRDYDLYCTYMTRFTDLLQRGILTDDPSGMFMRLNWYEYNGSQTNTQPEPVCYLRFEGADEKAMIALIEEWTDATTY